MSEQPQPPEDGQDSVENRAGNPADGPLESQRPGQGASPETLYLYLLRRFIGPRADGYLRIREARQRGEWPLEVVWLAFMLPLVWLFYRRMMLVALVVVAVAAALDFAVPGAALLVHAVLATALGLAGLGNVLYVQHAERKVTALMRRRLPLTEQETAAQHQGGVSVWDAVFGGILTLALLWRAVGLHVIMALMPFLDPILPSCNDPETLGIVENVVTTIAAEQGVHDITVTLEGAAQHGLDEMRRDCLVQARIGGQPGLLRVVVVWSDGVPGFAPAVQVSRDDVAALLPGGGNLSPATQP